MRSERYYMRYALMRAAAAARDGEAPIGAVIVKDGKIIAGGRNMREKRKNALLHAEIIAIEQACKRLGAWRLCGCEMYVTLEPCPMCAGAAINARLDRVVFGAYDKKAGAFGSVLDLNEFALNHKCVVEGGVMEEQCANILSEFFKKLRIERKNSG